MTVRIPMSWKRQGGRKVIIAPDGSEAWLPTKPRPDETLIHALARGASVEAIAGGGELIGGRRLPKPRASRGVS
jgi:hypothetical protein